MKKWLIYATLIGITFPYYIEFAIIALILIVNKKGKGGCKLNCVSKE